MTAPILILSVCSHQADRIQALDAGADDELSMAAAGFPNSTPESPAA
jgi:hypothetical protein